MPVHLFFGDDLYSLGRAIQRLRLDGEFEDVDVLRVNATQSKPETILMTLGTAGLFSTRRLAIVEGMGEAPRGRRSSAKSSSPETEPLTIEALVTASPSTTTVIVVGAGLRADAALIKEARLLAKAGRGVSVQEFRAPRQKDMAQWVARQSKEMKVKLEPGAIRQLALRVGEHVSIAAVELEKLSTAAGSDGIVTEAMVEDLVPKSAEEAIFPLIDAIATGRRDLTLRLLEAQLAQQGGSQVELSLRLLRLLARQFRLLLQIRLLLHEGRKRDPIVQELKLPDYYADRYFRQASAISETQLKRAMEQIAATEQSIKNGEASEAYLHLLLVDLTRPRSERPGSTPITAAGPSEVVLAR